MKLVKKRFADTAIFFGESEKTVDKLKPESLFNDVSKFAREVEATRKDRQEKEERYGDIRIFFDACVAAEKRNDKQRKLARKNQPKPLLLS